MRYAEDALDEAKEVWFEEGWEGGREEGLVVAARNALAKGVPPELVCEITGLDMETIKSIQTTL